MPYDLFFLFAYRPAEVAKRLAEGEVFAVRVGHKPCANHIELALLVEILLIDHDIYHLSNKHIVCAEGYNLLHTALDTHRRLLDNRSLYYRCRHGGQPQVKRALEIAAADGYNVIMLQFLFTGAVPIP